MGNDKNTYNKNEDIEIVLKLLKRRQEIVYFSRVFSYCVKETEEV